MSGTSRKGAGARPTESRVLRAVATVDRLERARPDEWTGEISRPWQIDEISGAHALPATGPRLDRRPPSKPPRPQSRGELALRLLTVCLFVATLLVFFAEAGLLAARRLSGVSSQQPWREVALSIDSDPAGAIVFIRGVERGRTPLSAVDFCRGRVIRLRLKAAGYSNWTWDGLCPARGPLVLRARLQALPGGIAPAGGSAASAPTTAPAGKTAPNRP